MLAAYKWFKEGLSIITSNHQIPWLISVLKQQPTMMNFVKKVFSEIDLGIKDFYIHDESFEEWVEHADTNDKEVVNAILGNTPRSDGEYRQAMSKMGTEVPELDIYEENGKRMVRELIFRQLGQEDYVGEMDVSSQSSGTLRLLTLTPAIYEAIFSPCTVVFDEIDNGVHPMLIKKLIRYFGDSQTQGQLIYTTHETALLNQQELLRTDEIWLTEKAEGVTKMYSLNDFKIHKTLSIENGYMDGRFGGIPTIGKI
jgi:energy-coupling factor transporter ATP-binding protein EcfA2